MRTIASWSAAFLVFATSSFWAIAADNSPTKAKPPAKSPDRPLTTAFDPSSTTLPATFIGHDPAAICRAFQSQKRSFEKSEFETREEWASRIAAWEQTKFLGSITPGDTLAFSAFLDDDLGSVSYDAEKNQISALMAGKSRYATDWNVLISRNIKPLGTVMAQTRMGVKFRIRQQINNRYHLSMTAANPSRLDGDYKFTFEPNDRLEAIRVKHLTRALFVGNLVPPYAKRETDHLTASLDDPIEELRDICTLNFKVREVWFYETLNKKIIHKWTVPD